MTTYEMRISYWSSDVFSSDLADARVEHADVDELALAGKLLVAHGGEDRDRGVHAGHQIGDRHADLHGRALRLAGQAHDAAHRLDQRIVAGPRRVGAGLAEAGDRTEDQPGNFLLELGVGQAVALQRDRKSTRLNSSH